MNDYAKRLGLQSYNYIGTGLAFLTCILFLILPLVSIFAIWFRGQAWEFDVAELVFWGGAITFGCCCELAVKFAKLGEEIQRMRLTDQQ